jgi:CheY-like chemotaxis protein
MSRIESGRMVLKNEDFSIRDFLDQINVIINGQCTEKGLDYECRVIGNIDNYYVGDDLKLKQVLINILGNSVKFTEAPGKISFSVEQIGRAEGKCTMRFTMRDTGIGMDKEFIPKLFEAFSQEDATTTNRYGGSGLGMAITGNLVDMMGGEIQVDSQKGVGSTFTVVVDLLESDMSMDKGSLDELLGKLSVIIIDDDAVACEHARLVLQEIGVEAEKCERSSDAYSIIRRRWDEGRPYDLIITDFKMPVMDGITLTEEIRRVDNGKTAIIILTGYDFDEQSERAHKEGVDGILNKPLFADTLLYEIQTVMRGRIEEMKGTDHDAAEDSAEVSLAGLRVLIAEDMEINASILSDILELEEIESEWAENGQIAIDKFSASEPGYYDAILMDIRMPVLDGLGAAKAIRAMDREDAKTIPIIALTANAFDEDVNNSIEAGMNSHLSKPVEPDKLFENLVKYAGQRVS